MRIVIHPEYKGITDFINNLPYTFETKGEILYQGRNSVRLYNHENLTLVVKKYKNPNIIQRVVYSFFKKSKAERAYLFAEKFREMGVSSPHEVAFIENKKNMLLKETYFVSLKSSLPSLDGILSKADFDKRAANQLAQFLVSLHEKGILHGDLNLTNILYQKDINDNLTFTLIDTNRSVIKSVVTKNDALENMVRLTHNKELLEYIVKEYSTLRGWDKQICCNFVMNKLYYFEQRRKIKYTLKEFIGLKK